MKDVDLIMLAFIRTVILFRIILGAVQKGSPCLGGRRISYFGRGRTQRGGGSKESEKNSYVLSEQRLTMHL